MRYSQFFVSMSFSFILATPAHGNLASTPSKNSLEAEPQYTEFKELTCRVKAIEGEGEDKKTAFRKDIFITEKTLSLDLYDLAKYVCELHMNAHLKIQCDEGNLPAKYLGLVNLRYTAMGDGLKTRKFNKRAKTLKKATCGKGPVPAQPNPPEEPKITIPEDLRKVWERYADNGYKEGKEPIPYRKRPAAVEFGEGTFDHTNDKRLRKVITLRSGDILRGQGPDKTILKFQNLVQMGYPCEQAWRGGLDKCWDSSGGVVATGIHDEEVGIEDLTIVFEPHTFRHYRSPPGYNAIWLKDCTNCWVKNVRIINADNGIVITAGSSNVTVEDVEISNAQHKAASMGGDSFNNIVRHLVIHGPSIHGIDIGYRGSDNVFASVESDSLLNYEPNHNQRTAPSEYSAFSNIYGAKGTRALRVDRPMVGFDRYNVRSGSQKSETPGDIVQYLKDLLGLY